MINIRPIEAFSDNYIWILDDGASAWVVDPGDAAPVVACIQEQGLVLEGILITHHHPDHVGGIDNLRSQYTDLTLVGPRSEHINQARIEVEDGSIINALGIDFNVISIPGHTLDHIAYTAVVNDKPVVFCGDTLFAGGCGRIFEGNPKQMWQSLQKLTALPEASLVYCAHEYTLANLAFAAEVEPNNEALKLRISQEQEKRRVNTPTVPTTVAKELATNPFLRADQPEVINSAQLKGAASAAAVDVFAAVRAWKDTA